MLTAFLCRWPTEDPIPVSLPPDATDEQREALEAALRAWEGAGLGIRFERREFQLVGIEIRFVGPDSHDPLHARTGGTVADCLVGREVFDEPESDVLPARMTFASIHLSRSNLDTLGRVVPLDPDEVTGSALHELGHALGFQGHALHGGSAMVRSVDRVRAVGRRARAGKPFEDRTLKALYALPSGVVVRRTPVDPASVRIFEQLREAAEREGYFGPFARSGDRVARIGWRAADGESVALTIDLPREVLRGRRPLELDPSYQAQDLLGR